MRCVEIKVNSMSQLTDINTLPALPTTPLALFIALCSGKLIPHSLWQSPKFRRKYLLRGLLLPVPTYTLLTMLTRHPHYEQLLSSQPRLPCRNHRPYLTNRLGRQAGARAVILHYQHITERLGVTLFAQHLGGAGLCLAQIAAKDEQRYVLSLISTHTLDREGETSIILRDAAGQLLCELTFTLCQHHGQLTLMIGGLQGPNNPDAQQIVQQATKTLYGLFPKRVVFEALLQVSKWLDVKAICAVSNATHVYRSLRYGSRKKLMHADYNDFWEMLGGTATAEGYYSLPAAIPRKEMEEIASKKRSEYRKRYALLDQLEQDIRQVLPRPLSTHVNA